MIGSLVPINRSAPGIVGAPDIWRSLRSEMDRLFGGLTGGLGLPSAFDFSPLPAFGFEREFVASPAADVAEDDKSFTVSVELPGMSEKDIHVSLSGERLTIEGEKQKKKDEKNEGYYLSERVYGKFQRSFMLPDGIDSGKVAAKFSNGVLTLTLPKKTPVAPKQIEVKAAT